MTTTDAISERALTGTLRVAAGDDRTKAIDFAAPCHLDAMGLKTSQVPPQRTKA